MAQTVLITGASSGFGRETAKLFQRAGWNVIASMRHPEKEILLAGLDHVLLVALDVTDKTSIDKAVHVGQARFGRIDALVNNAGFGATGAFETASTDDIRRQFDVNVFGAMAVTQAVLPHMRQARSGAIVNISSFGGVVGQAFGTLYASSKFALEGFSEALSQELDFLKIKVAIVEPGSVATNFREAMTHIPTDIPEYTARLQDMMPAFIARTADLPKATAQEVAQTIFAAATDGRQDKLRYVVGADAQYYIDLKAKKSEAEFLKVLRS